MSPSSVRSSAGSERPEASLLVDDLREDGHDLGVELSTGVAAQLGPGPLSGIAGR